MDKPGIEIAAAMGEPLTQLFAAARGGEKAEIAIASLRCDERADERGVVLRPYHVRCHSPLDRRRVVAQSPTKRHVRIKLADRRLNERNETAKHHPKTRLGRLRVECVQLSEQHWELEPIE